MSWLLEWDGQSIGTSASASVLPMNIQGWFSLGLTGLISLPSEGLSRVFCSTTVQKYKFFVIQPPLRICLQCRRPGFNSWDSKIPWRRKQQSTPVFLPGESHGKGAWQATDHGVARVGHNLVTKPPSSWSNSHICTWLLDQTKNIFMTQTITMLWSLS